MGHGAADAQGRFAERLFAFIGGGEGELVQGGAFVLVLALHLLEAVQDVLGAFHRVAHLPVEILFLERQLGEIGNGVIHAGVFQGAGGLAGGFAVGAGVEIVLLAATDQQDAIAAGVRHVVQHQCLRAFTVECTALHHLLEVTLADLIELLRRVGQVPTLEDADHDAGAALFFRVACGQGVLHGVFLVGVASD